MEEEQAKAEARKAARDASIGAPLRFFCMPGESREIVIVDEAPDFFRHEHALLDSRSKRWDNYVPCIDEHANCPVCAVAERPAYFAMYLTIIDLTPYTNKAGEEVEFSKKLLVIKPTQQKKIMRLYDRHKSLRGMVLQMTRDTKEDAQIGNDIEFVEMMDEDDLLQYETEYTDKENKVHPVICHEPFDYDALFPDMTEKQLRAVAGGKAPEAGSRDSNRETLGSNDDAWEKEPARGARTASRRSVRDEQDDDAPAPAARRSARAAPVPEDDEPAPAARRGRVAPAQDDEPAPRTVRRGRAAEPADDEQGDDLPWNDKDGGDADVPAEQAPTQRRAARTPTRAAKDDDADNAPQRPANSVAARRASLRR